MVIYIQFLPCFFPILNSPNECVKLEVVYGLFLQKNDFKKILLDYFLGYF